MPLNYLDEDIRIRLNRSEQELTRVMFLKDEIDDEEQ
jgi:hypothetical protein